MAWEMVSAGFPPRVGMSRRLSSARSTLRQIQTDRFSFASHMQYPWTSKGLFRNGRLSKSHLWQKCLFSLVPKIHSPKWMLHSQKWLFHAHKWLFHALSTLHSASPRLLQNAHSDNTHVTAAFQSHHDADQAHITHKAPGCRAMITPSKGNPDPLKHLNRKAMPYPRAISELAVRCPLIGRW